jgi:hypothetical protein
MKQCWANASANYAKVKLQTPEITAMTSNPTYFMIPSKLEVQADVVE